MIINIDGEINSELVDTIVDVYNKLEEEEKLTILLRSNGGENDATSAILHVIHEHASATNIVGYGGLLSNGFRLFFEAKCSKQVLHDTHGMFHLTRNAGIIIYEGGVTRNAEYDEFKRKTMNSFYYLEKIDKYVGFTRAEIKSIKANEDCFFNEDRLNEMIEYNKKKLKW